MQLSAPKQKLLIAELVLTHFGSPKPNDDVIVRYLDHPTNCSFDAIRWDLPTENELSTSIKLQLRRQINEGIQQHAFCEQQMWHRLANKQAGISSQTADNVTVQQLNAKLDYLKEHLFPNKPLL